MGIGANWSPSSTLTVSGIGHESIGSTVDYIVYVGGGSYSGNSPFNLYVNGGIYATGFVASSDRRIKKKIKKNTLLERINNIQGRTYEFKNAKLKVGIFATGVAKISNHGSLAISKSLK